MLQLNSCLRLMRLVASLAGTILFKFFCKKSLQYSADRHLGCYFLNKEAFVLLIWTNILLFGLLYSK